MAVAVRCPKQLKKLVCIEYPGIVENVGPALETLNGLAAIESTVNNEGHRLELRFRPDDVYSHPTFGDRSKCDNLLVKFIRRKKADGRVELEAEMIGVVETVFQFKSLADFQYLPLAKTSDGQNYQPIADQILPNNPINPDHRSPLDRKFDPTAPLFILPTIFSRFDAPIEYHFKTEAQHRDSEMRQEMERQSQLSIIGRTRKSRCVIACLLNWRDPVPEQPPEEVSEAIDQQQAKTNVDQKLMSLLVSAFAERPIWSRNALVARLACQRSDLKYLLPKVAYYFVNGPFRCMWIKFGYDPRLDVGAKVYQTLDFRVKQVYAKKMSSERIRAKRSIYQYQLHLKKSGSETKSPILSFDSLPSTSKAQPQPAKAQSQGESTYKFRIGLVPEYRQLFYQLCDIEVPKIQELIHANDGREPIACSEKDGWCGVGVIDQIRAMMSKIIDQLLVDLKKEELLEGGDAMDPNEDEAETSSNIQREEFEEDEDSELFEDELLEYIT